MNQDKIELSWMDEDGEEVSHSFPAKNEVCGRCEGFGTHLNPSIGQHAYSMEEFEESFPEDEDKEQYFRRGGIYDVQCEQCHGNKVVLVVNEDALTEEQKKLYEDYQRDQEEDARMEAEDRHTRMMEDGGFGWGD